MQAAGLKPKVNYAAVKRGDTIIEVMFAIAVFCLVAVISIAMMNLGVANAENALETVVARNELNAQAEALRFIHSSYISERTLPLREDLLPAQIAAGEKYQQYRALWEKITENAVRPDIAKDSGLLDLADFVNNKDSEGGAHKVGCARVYDQAGGGSPLSKVNAFVLNTRDLSSINDTTGQTDVGVSYIDYQYNRYKFIEATLNARIIFKATDAEDDDDDSSLIHQFTDGGVRYDRVAVAEGIWAFAVTDGSSPEATKYFDFYIEACWYGPNTVSPTAVDTVIRLYNPEGI